MNYTIHEGSYDRMGVWSSRGEATFTFHGEKEDDCSVILIDKKTKERTCIFVPSAYCLGSLRSVTVCGITMKNYYYTYLINGKEILDDYAPVIAGREIYFDTSREEKGYKIYGASCEDDFDWKEDENPEVSSGRMVMYKLHVRGFTMDTHMRAKGTFAAVEERIPYLKNLGITTVELMPVYEFEEMPLPKEEQKLPDYIKWEQLDSDLIAKPPAAPKQEGKQNYWGYGPGNYFAVKASYASKPNDASFEFKHLVRALHEAGMECVMEMFFPDDVNQNLILDALRYWVREYHIDGVHLMGNNLPMTAIVQDVILSRTKIFYMEEPPKGTKKRRYERYFVYREDYQYPARRILNHLNGDLAQLLDHQKRKGRTFSYVNYIASNNGFTLADTFMYNDKHNEANGENNIDGDTWNFSHNYGVEGDSRKKSVMSIRHRMWRNAMALIMLAQGVPLIWMGDECGNSQQGNNNAYCQDNPIGWVNWKKGKETDKKEDYLQKLIAFRKAHPALTPKDPFTMADKLGSGFPDLSYHGTHAWISDAEYGSMAVGLLYNGAYTDPSVSSEERKRMLASAGMTVELDGTEDVYVAFNFFSNEMNLALPQIGRNRQWRVIMSTDREEAWVCDPQVLPPQQYITMPPQTVSILMGW